MKNSSIFFTVFLAITMLIYPTKPLVAQDVQVTAGSNRINIPPYIRDWEAAADLFFINLSCTFQQPTQIVLAIELTEDRRGRIAFGQSDVVYVPNAPFQQIITNSDFTHWDTWDYDESLKNQIQRTGRLPDGVYNLCIEVLVENNPSPVADFCYLFETFLPQNVQLIIPDDEQTINNAYPMFQWTPIPWTQVVYYNLVVVQIIEGQQPQDAIAINDVFFQDVYPDENSVIYPPTALALEAGFSYAWFIFCEDEFGKRIGENNGESQIYSFQYEGKNQANIKDWRDSVKEFTSPSYLQNASIKDDPCPSIQELINSIQKKLKLARSNYQKGERKKAEGEAQAKKGEQDAKDAAKALAEAQAKLDKAKQQRDAILNAINKKNGASIVKPDFEFTKGALIGSTNGGSLQLDAGTSLFIPADKIDDWLKSFNALRSEYEGYTKQVSEHSKTVADQKRKKKDGETDKANGTKKATEGQTEMDVAAKEIAELEQALEDLKVIAKKCGDIIKDLKAAAKKASSKLMTTGVKVDGASRGSGGSGSKANQHANNAKEKLKEAENAFSKGDYALAEKLAGEADEEAEKSKIAAQREDCYKKAKAKVDAAQADLDISKDRHPKSDHSAAESAISSAKKTLDEVKQAINTGDYALAERLCKKVYEIIDFDFRPKLSAIKCNEGSTSEGVRILVADYQVGNIYITTQLTPGNIGHEMYSFLNSIGDPLGINASVDNVYKLTSVGHAYDLYSVWAKYYVVVDYVCENGQWVTKNMQSTKTDRKIYFKLEKQIIQSRDLKKAMLEENNRKLYNSLGAIKKDEIIERIFKNF